MSNIDITRIVADMPSVDHATENWADVALGAWLAAALDAGLVVRTARDFSRDVPTEYLSTGVSVLTTEGTDYLIEVDQESATVQAVELD